MDNIPEQDKSVKFITLTSGWDGMPIAFHLQEEGHESVIGQVQDKSELDQKSDEEPEDKKKRLSQYDGMIKKYPAEKLVKALKKVEDKDSYFIYCDSNSLYPYAEELLKAGFTKGIFPTKEDYDMEKEREDAMNFVEENYPDVQIIPHQKFSTVDEARAFVEESETPLVIQSEGDFVSTIVGPDDVEQSKNVILAALDQHEQDYSKGEIIIKEKLVGPIEVTPQMVFWNGEPVFTDLDIETKNIGDGENNGCQVGCGTNLIIRTDFDDPINQIAFPPKVYEMAKAHTGIFVWDIALYFTDHGIFFGEFCSNRFGYDALMTEMCMSGGANNYFSSIMRGQDPLQAQYGTALRVFNLMQKEQEIVMDEPKMTWLYGVKKGGEGDEDKLKSTEELDLGVITGCGNDVEGAVKDLYNNYNTLTFKEKYARTEADFLKEYPTSIMTRLKGLEGIYF